MSTTGRSALVLRIFKGRRNAPTPRDGGALPAAGPYLRLSRFQGSTNPCASAAHMEPFPLRLQSSHLNICYYHQDLHRRRPPARALGFAATAAPSYSSRPGSCPDGRYRSRAFAASSSSSPPTVDGSNWDLRAQPSEPILFRLRIHFADFLAYIVPSTRGCSPWRPDAVMSTTGVSALGPPDFQGPPECTDTTRRRCSSSRWTLPPAEPLPGWAGC
ncbi:hypothetical protein Bca52824_094604 [Brassica carinata]|uniref:Uncharacterized protein n=1 Tax=Brassica carinata TaxID=52824 RepID=A0A8X7P1T6_BRACI|nr:hypothetical protein Bca52824_094604 [Brassica carinata]